MTIGALRESARGESRAALVPEVAEKLARTGAVVLIERGAAASAQFPDGLFSHVEWADSPAAVLARADVLLTVQPLGLEQIAQLKQGAVVIGFMQAHARPA
jgi:NAD(P) transhydrogenase subunit alpha